MKIRLMGCNGESASVNAKVKYDDPLRPLACTRASFDRATLTIFRGYYQSKHLPKSRARLVSCHDHLFERSDDSDLVVFTSKWKVGA